MSSYNPFNPNSVVVPRLFAGRATQVLDITKKLSHLAQDQPASFFIYGERGIGKTALAKLIRSIATAKDPGLYNLNLVTSYYSVEAGQDLSSVLQASLNNLTDQMPSGLIDILGTRLGDLLKNGKFKIGAFGASVDIEPNVSEVTRQITIKDQVVSILGNIIRALDPKESDSSQAGILIIIDEMHNLADIKSAASIFRNVITTLDVEGLGRVAFLLIGYDQDMEHFFQGDSSARRTFDIHELNVMPDEEAIQVLEKGFKAAEPDLKWDADQLKQNIHIAGGYPHSIQVLGHNLVERDTNQFIDAYDWANGIVESVVELRRKEFSTMYSFGKTITEKDRILLALAKENRPMTRAEIANITGLKNVYQSIGPLKRSGAIKEDEDRRLALQSQLFRSAIMFHHAAEQQG